ncbi:MAG: ornithine carbamoyltransferase [Phycisphaeraceae bacterium]|nr:ornithine carbamoyltransferase [Phycisphaeraceae bacterium]
MAALAPRSSIPNLRQHDVLRLSHLTRDDVLALFKTARAMKKDPSEFSEALKGRSIAMLFEKPSLRTRVSFEVGIYRLGAQPVYLDHSEKRLGERETVADYGHNLERWVHAIVARVYKQTVLEQMSEASGVPVVNALSDMFHPCQALADFMTLQEKRSELKGLRLAYVGDGNNVCHSLMELGAILGAHVTAITPAGRDPTASVLEECKAIGAKTGSELKVTHDLADIAGHDAVYTDVWVSMGQGSETDRIRKLFKPFQVNAALMQMAAAGAKHTPLFMHCLPAHRGSEVTDEVIDSPASIVFDQAENRMHAQMALLLHMLRD